MQEMDEAKEAPEARHQVYRRKQTAPARTEEMPPIHGPYTGSSLRPSTPHGTLLDIVQYTALLDINNTVKSLISHTGKCFRYRESSMKITLMVADTLLYDEISTDTFLQFDADALFHGFIKVDTRLQKISGNPKYL